MNRLIFSCIGLIALCNISLAQGVDVAISKQQANISLNRAQGFMGSLNLKIENIKLEKDFLFDRLNSFKTETDDAVCYVNPEKNCISVFVKKKLESSKDIDKIKQSSAMQLSQKYLTAAGIDLNELELLRCELNNDSGRMRWEICYLRSYNKFTFLQDHAFVSINPSTGELEALGCDLNSPLPESVAVSVRIESAERNARDYMNAIIGPLGKLTNSKLAIINPDNNWESYGTGNTSLQDKSRTRLAWILEYDAPWDNTTVFVDAVDGNVIGGFRSRSSPKSAIKDQVLLTSKLVTISYNNHKKSISIKNTTIQNLITQLNNLKLVSNSNSKSMQYIITFSGGKRTRIYSYSPIMHRLVLCEQIHNGYHIKGNIVFETTIEFDNLITKLAKYK